MPHRSDEELELGPVGERLIRLAGFLFVASFVILPVAWVAYYIAYGP